MKAYNIPLYIRLSIASFLGWSVLRVVCHHCQLHGMLPFGITLPGALSIAGFLIGLFAGSSLLLGTFFSFCQWIVLRSYIKSPWTWILYQNPTTDEINYAFCYTEANVTFKLYNYWDNHRYYGFNCLFNRYSKRQSETQ